MEFKNPFLLDKSGKVQFPWNPISDKVFILPSPPPERHGSLIEIPQQFREEYRDNFGVLLAIGPGYYDKKGIFHPTHSCLQPGIKVYFDVTVPWKYTVQGLDGQQYAVVLCGTADLFCILED